MGTFSQLQAYTVLKSMTFYTDGGGDAWGHGAISSRRVMSSKSTLATAREVGQEKEREEGRQEGKKRKEQELEGKDKSILWVSL